MDKGQNEKKSGFRFNPLIVTMVVSIMIIIGQFMGFSSKFTEVKVEVKHLTEDIAEIKGDFDKLDEFQKDLTEIKIQLGKIEESIKSLKR